MAGGWFLVHSAEVWLSLYKLLLDTIKRAFLEHSGIKDDLCLPLPVSLGVFQSPTPCLVHKLNGGTKSTDRRGAPQKTWLTAPIASRKQFKEQFPNSFNDSL